MFLDSDANQATGDPESLGADFVIQLIQGEILLFKWDGSDFTLSATQASLNYTWANGPTIKINASDLNNTRKLSFDVTTVSGLAFDPTSGAIDCTNCHRDFAPTIGFFTYEVKVAKPTLVVQQPEADAGQADGRQAVHASTGRGSVGHGSCRPERPSHVPREARDRSSQGSDPGRAGRGGGLHVEHPVEREGQDLHWLGDDRVRRAEGGGRATPGRSASSAAGATSSAPRLLSSQSSSPPGRRLARAISTPRIVVERATQKVHPAPDLAGFRRNASNRVRVIMTLDSPPLAAATYARGLGALGTRSKLNVRSAFSRSYLGTLQAEQATAIAKLHQEIPQAIVSRRYQVLVNGFAVSVPYSRLPDLLETGIAKRVYPSLTYHLDLNRGPSVVGAPAFSALTGAKGDGVKVAVVDDGIDPEHPFLDPTGFSYPSGFPKGTSGSTTPKVIVARGFAGPGANSAPLDRDTSFHATFVAGVIAGVKTDVEAGQTGFCSEANGGCHPAVKGVEGVAPRAYLGNYRVFNVPAPAPLGGCCSANSPEIVAAFEAAVRDGMDIINFSGGGPQADPRTDILIEAVSNVVRAGVVPVISAGNDRDFFGLGTAGSPATAPDAISVGAVANAHVFGASLQVVSPSGLPRMPFAPTDAIPPSWISANQRLLDVGSISGVSRQLCDAAPAGSMTGAIALVEPGGLPVRRESVARTGGRGDGHRDCREPSR